MLNDRKWQEIAANATDYLKVGWGRHHLFDNEMDRPWQYVNSIETGGTYRWGCPINIHMKAVVSGIEFSWSVDIEDRNAEGGLLKPNLERLRQVIELLPSGMASKFVECIAEFAVELKTQRDKQREFVDRMDDDLHALRQLL